MMDGSNLKNRFTQRLTALAALLTLSVSAPVMLGSCAATKRVAHKTNEVAANLLLPPEQEEALGRQFKQEIEQQAQMHPDPVVQQYLDRVGNLVLSKAANRPRGLDFDFHVIDEPDTINAFAIPGGDIYIYSGLIRAADTEAELAGVLAHEIAHVTERHIAERLTAAYGLEFLASLALGRNPGQVSAIVTSMLGQGYLLKFGRDQEREADVSGLRTMIRTGYTPTSMIDFFEKLKGGPRTPALLASHPHPEERVETLERLLSQADARGGNANIVVRDLSEIKQRL